MRRHHRQLSKKTWSTYAIVSLNVGFMLVLSQGVTAQYVNFDSLRQAATHAKTDSEKIKALTLLADNYSFNTDSEFYYGTLAKEAAAKAGDKGAEAYAVGDIAEAFMRKGNFVQGLRLTYQITKTFQELKDSVRLANSYGELSELYIDQDNPQLAKRYAHLEYDLARSIGDHRDEFFGTHDLSGAYASLHQLDSALYYEKRALQILDNKQVHDSRAFVLLGLSEVYDQQHQDSLSMQCLTEALMSAARLNDPYLSRVQIAYANKLVQQNKLDSALYYANQAAQAIESNRQLFRRHDLYNLLSQIYSRKKQFEQAYQYQSKALQLNDSLYSVEQSQQVANLTFNAQQHQLDLQNAAVAYQNRLRLYATLGVLALAVVVVFFLFSRTKKQQRANTLLQQQKEETETQRTKAETALEELKATQTQLVQREKMASLGELTAGIAHEIQNPLNFVNNFSEVNKELIVELKQEVDSGNLAEVKALADDIEKNQDKIAHHGKRAEAIVKGMLEHSRASTGTKEPTDINALVEEYLKLSYHGMRAKDKNFNATLQTDFDPSLGKLAVVPQDLGRVFLNLFNNAFYATAAKKKKLNGGYEPVVSVRTKCTNGAVEVRIEDNGTGIPQAILEKIFQPFFTTKPAGQGTGLGLSLSYDIVTKGHGGELRVESKEGEGAAFVIRLPE